MPRTMVAVAAMFLLSGFSARCTDEKPLTFQAVAMGEIEDGAATNAGFQTRGWLGAYFGFITYKTSNGDSLAVYCDDFDKPEEAKRFLDFKAASAFKVLSRSAKRDADGKPIKYRVELIPDSDSLHVEVMWVVGAAVHWIYAQKLDDALAFEKLYKN